MLGAENPKVQIIPRAYLSPPEMRPPTPLITPVRAPGETTCWRHVASRSIPTVKTSKLQAMAFVLFPIHENAIGKTMPNSRATISELFYDVRT